MAVTKVGQEEVVCFGQEGRPANYPNVAQYPGLLFYIQRNQNINTVVYEVNLQSAGLINLEKPVHIYWLQYDENRNTTIKELNYIQKKLAYGYHHRVISSELIEFRFVSYDLMKFYLARDKDMNFKVYTNFNDNYIELDMMYIYAEDLGVFPQVKFAEFYGKYQLSGEKFYKKLILQ